MKNFSELYRQQPLKLGYDGLPEFEDTIAEFRAQQHRWLSNFAPVLIVLEGVVYTSVEHAYMSAKSDDPGWKKFCSDESTTAANAKKASYRLQTLRQDWAEIKVKVMRDCLVQKFSQEPYKSLLLGTKKYTIIEGNWHKDDFWGVDRQKNPAVGENMLGRLIMEIRDELLRA